MKNKGGYVMQEMLNIQVLNDKLEVEKGTKFETLAKKYQKYFKSPILLAKQSNRLIELSNTIQKEGEIIFYDISQDRKSVV